MVQIHAEYDADNHQERNTLIQHIHYLKVY
jgi:hypothetical protein